MDIFAQAQDWYVFSRSDFFQTPTSLADSPSVPSSDLSNTATTSLSDGAIIGVKEDAAAEDEAQLRSHLLEQQAELIRLQKQKLEYEVAQAKAKLEQQNQELRLREQVVSLFFLLQSS